MLKFSEYLNKNPESILNWDGSFASNRHQEKESILSWGSSHSELRNKKIQEHQAQDQSILTESQIIQHPDTNILEPTGLKIKDQGPPLDLIGKPSAIFYDRIHKHPSIIPQQLTQSDQYAIKNYSFMPSESERGHGSSHNINNYLRNRSGFHDLKVLHHSPENVEKSVRRLSAAFTPENTNRTAIKTYSGIPTNIGEHLLQSPIGSKHTLAGFTSTSTDFTVANGYALCAMDQSHHIKHFLVAHVEPGAGLSIVKHSPYDEDEILLHHGAHITYRGSEPNKDQYNNISYFHHITVHPTHKSLDDYEPYKE